MKLSKKAVEEYKRIYRKCFGEELKDREAYESARKLLELFKAVYDSPPCNKDKIESK